MVPQLPQTHTQDTDFSAENNPVVTVDEALTLAQGHHKSGNLLLAERTYRDILRSIPDHFPTTQFLGVLLFQAGHFSEARDLLEKAAQAAPADKNVLNNYAGTLTQYKDYEKALDLYNKALVIDSNYLDALNNKSHVLWQLNKLREAEEVSRQALSLFPENIVALINLGVILSKRIKYEEALDVWQKASELKPEDALIWVNWGNTLREMGRLVDSEQKCRKAVELAPKNPEALSNLANALRDLGKLDEAIELYRKATNEKPDYYQAHSNMAIALSDNMRFEEAAVAGRYAVAFKDDFIEGYNALSRAYFEIGDYDKAHKAAQRSIHLNPDSIIPYLDLAEILLHMEQLDDAEAALQEALKREPDSPRAYLKLSEIREHMNNFIAAHAAIDKAIRMSPDMAVLWLRKGLIYYSDSEVDKGIEMMDTALGLTPNWAVPLQHKAEMLISINREEDAEKLIRKIISLSPDLPTPYVSLVGLKKFESEDDPDFQTMLKLLKNVSSFGDGLTASFYYAISEAYEQMKKYDQAFEYLKKANDIKHKSIPFITWRDMDFYSLVKERYTPEYMEFYKGKGYPSEVPVFIVGMPRSGTTLTEQIIAAHPKAYGAGELAEMTKMNKMAIATEVFDAYALGEEYVRRIQQRDKSGQALRIVDKMPANYMYLGLIANILPNAKIIHCRRDPIDTCLSCYKQNFARGQYWSYDLEELAKSYQDYLDLMAYWKKLLPANNILEIDYEETVMNFEPQARKIIDFIGLEWDPACLEPHMQKRVVLTASKSQVTKPLYKTSVEKWRIYEKQLQPLVRKLAPEKALPDDKA